MSFLKSVDPPSLTSARSDKIVSEYRALREIGVALNSKITQRLPKDVLEEGGRKLGMLQDGMFVFESEDMTSVLMEYCIYDVRRRGRNAVEQYLCDSPPDPQSDEMLLLRAMQQAWYSIVLVEAVFPGIGAHVDDVVGERKHLLVDIGFSRSAKPGLVILSRLLPFDGYVITSGAALPVGLVTPAEAATWRRHVAGGVAAGAIDPAEMIREALSKGVASSIVYAEPKKERHRGTGRRGSGRRTSPNP